MIKHNVDQDAVDCIIREARPNTLIEVYRQTHNLSDRKLWGWVSIHHRCGIGLWVRNTLRKNGSKWGSFTLDSLWYGVLIEAAKQFVRQEGETEFKALLRK